MVRFGSQGSHGLKSWAIKSILNAPEVGPTGHDFSHYLGVTCGHHEVVSIIPGDITSRGPKASRLRCPPKALAERV
eukprot:3166379-Amphidinium_carterae.1